MSEFSQYQWFHRSRHWLNFNESWDQIPETLSEPYPSRHNHAVKSVFFSLRCMETHLLWRHKYHGGHYVVLGEWYKNAHNICLEQFYIWALNVIIYTTIRIHLLCIFFSFIINNENNNSNNNG